ncbi:hypothetical protein [endosymbiont of unidentified scaly snail isolate Monju]|uniref:hypothetical protein n=1 Tax=endosymbiont of unidentified scaly snail isolate Monju TaxID=1248727 RepID=UPI0005BC8DC1|nr:hypothetical protein [endosymbiont of unidentified scaly snail isolate Monju]
MATYLTTQQLSERIPYPTRHIRDYLKDRIFIEGHHYIRAPGGRKLLFIWENVEATLRGDKPSMTIPMAGGGFCHG